MSAATDVELIASVSAIDATAETVRRALDELLDRHSEVGTSLAFDILAGEPRIKPSRGLLIDPTDSVRRRWSLRVAAGTALVESASAARVFPELLDELSDCADLAREVLALAEPHPDLSSDQQAALLALASLHR